MSVCVFVKLPVSMEEMMDLLNEVNQQLEDVGEVDEDQVDYPVTSTPGQPAGRVKFSSPSSFKSVTSPSKRSVVRHDSDVSAQTLRAVADCLCLPPAVLPQNASSLGGGPEVNAADVIPAVRSLEGQSNINSLLKNRSVSLLLLFHRVNLPPE